MNIKQILHEKYCDYEDNFSNYYNISLNFLEHNIFNFYEIDTSKDIIEIPIFYRGHAESFLENDKCNKIVLPLFSIDKIYSKSSLNTISKLLETRSNYGLIEVNFKNEIYYGCKGLILDENKNMLLSMNVRYKKENINNCIFYKPFKIVCRINYNVYKYKTTLNKYILNKIIPYLSNTELYYSAVENSFDYQYYKSKVEIVISDDENIIKPIPPDIIENLDDTLNNTLIKNIEDIMSFI